MKLLKIEFKEFADPLLKFDMFKIILIPPSDQVIWQVYINIGILFEEFPNGLCK